MTNTQTSQMITTTILSRHANGICSITGKTGEVFELRHGNGEIQTVLAKNLVEVLRTTCSIRLSPAAATSESAG
jgi:hypothetical protein